ncbi:hypothetical protein [Prosthecobacter sp.]|uniref:hypothetical protein n=1 Tax=Prosthecobacter sp. TaxID=1965333 RepID=UPI0024895950|nr:hypothetical protein [Prosthecobacter sp.]MDI1312133.1 hypothetical protein [Prosthecobacter sp.]
MKPNFVPAIENPCPVKWESMVGDEKRRYCEHCQLHVHNLSAMTAAERNEALAPSSEQKCISYLTRLDQRAPAGKAVLKLQFLSRLPQWLTALIAVFTSSCTQPCRIGGVPLPPSQNEHPAKTPHADDAR